MATSRVQSLSPRVVLSYLLDWVTLIAIAAVAYSFDRIAPVKRPFSLTDPNISFPYKGDTVSAAVLVAVAFVAPVVIIALLCLTVVPHRFGGWRRKLWELHAAELGLCLSLASAYLITNGSKELFGKPRPNLLARCNPNVADVSKDTVGGFGDINPGMFLVTSAICQTQGDFLDEGFRSFPSGHSSFSVAGLGYLTLFLCAKFAITIPFLAPRLSSDSSSSSSSSSTVHANNSSLDTFTPITGTRSSRSDLFRSEAAAPPVYLLILAFLPVGVAIYISSSRWTDFQHHGFDIIVGDLLGLLMAWMGFRWYHLPVRRGAGWAWGPRSKPAAFGIRVGMLGYGAGQGEGDPANAKRDLERGPVGAANAVSNEREEINGFES